MRQCLLPAVLVVCFLVASPDWAATVEVTVKDFAFDPEVVNISVGDTVVWTNVQGTHSVVANDGSFASGSPQGAPWTFSHTFNSAGSTGYHCGFHFIMQGTVNVAEGSPPEPCAPSSTVLCLNGDRFQVEMSWRSNAADPLVPAMAVPLPFAPSSGLFYFFGAENIEMLVKVLNACIPALGNKYWVFFSATTNVEFQLTVTDTDTGERKLYLNPLHRPAPPVQDTDAFETCP